MSGGKFQLTVSNASEIIDVVDKTKVKELGANGAIVGKILKGYFDQGYVIVSSNSGGAGGGGVIVTNYILKKE